MIFSSVTCVRRTFVISTLLMSLGPATAADLKPGPQGDPTLDSTGQFRQQEYRVPFARDDGGPLLQALLLFPKGDPPHPLVIPSIMEHHAARRTVSGARFTPARAAGSRSAASRSSP